MKRTIKASELKPEKKVLRGQTVLVPYPTPKNRQEELAWTVATTIERTDIWNGDFGCYRWKVRYEDKSEGLVDEDAIMQYVLPE